MDTIDSENIISEDTKFIMVVAARTIEDVVLVMDELAWREVVADPVVLEEPDVPAPVVDTERRREESLEWAILDEVDEVTDVSSAISLVEKEDVDISREVLAAISRVVETPDLVEVDSLVPNEVVLVANDDATAERGAGVCVVKLEDCERRSLVPVLWAEE